LSGLKHEQEWLLKESVMRSVFCAEVWVTLSWFVEPTVSAQSATRSLRGSVYDIKGAVVDGASVTLINSTTGFTRLTKSAQGNYQLLELPPAAYDLTVRAAPSGRCSGHGYVLCFGENPASLVVVRQGSQTLV
jgi:Carboxypeptidase regulatory-like domain